MQLINVIDEDVKGGGERGLVNILADPNFPSNGFFYLFYTAGTPQRDRVSRFTLVGNTASLDSEVVIWQGAEDSTSTDHHGGGLLFGLDGKFYVSTGDNGSPTTSQALRFSTGPGLTSTRSGPAAYAIRSAFSSMFLPTGS
jgi:glucose/arabinose dehydrogenase